MRSLGPKAREVLRLLAEGRSDKEILAAHPKLRREDIADAAREALAALPSYSIDDIRKEHPRAYEKWSNDEERRLLALYGAGRSTRQIAQELGRQSGGIRSRLDRLLGGETPSDDGATEVREPPPEDEPATPCTACGRAIPAARLEAVPSTRLCVHCQEKAEHPEPDENDDLECPRCGSRLLWKQPRDPRETTYFLACSGYPRCRYIDPTTGHGFKRR